MGDYSSLYKYEKFEIIGDELVPLGIFSVDGNGTMPLVFKDDCDPQCGCPEPIYRWIQTEDTVCIEVITYKLQATYSDSSTLNVECDSSTSLLKAESQPTGHTASAMTDAIIGDCVTTIGDSYNYTQAPFRNCYSLSSVTIPSSVTTIGRYAFYGCSGLTSITIPSGVTSIYEAAFSRCSGLTAIYVEPTTPPALYDSEPFWNTGDCPIYVPCESVSAYQTAWSRYSSRIEGIPPCSQPTPTQYRWTQSGTTCIGYDKYQNNIKEQSTDGGTTWTVVVPEEYSASTLIETQSTDCGYVPPTPASPKFTLTLNDSSTVSVECDSTSAITSGEVATQYSGSVVSAVIGDCVTMIGSYAFSNCSSLTSVTIPNTVTLLNSDAFSHSGLLTLNIPNSVETIRNYAVYDCLSLTSVTIGAGVTTIGARAFNRSSNLQSIYVLATTPPTLENYAFDRTNNCPIYVPCESVSAYQSATGWSNYASKIQGIPPCGQPTPTIDGKFKLTLNDSSTVTAECDSTSAITSGEVATQYSGSVVSAVIGDCVSSIGDTAFANCRSLTSVTIPSSVISISGRAFEGCTSLTSIDIPDSVTNIGEFAFEGCSGLTSVVIPDNVTSIMYGAFERCTSVTSCTIGDGIVTISSNLFRGCLSLSRITIPNNITSLGNASFSACTSLSRITIPNSVTSIGHSIFQNCTGLTSVTIGNGATSIGNTAFANCSSLQNITCLATTPATLGGQYTFYGTNNCPIYVPCESVSAYQTAWDGYVDTSRIQATPTQGDYQGIYKGVLSNGGVGIIVRITGSTLTSGNVSSHREDTVRANIGTGVTAIDDNTFSGFTMLKEANIASTVTSIGNNAFKDCPQMNIIRVNATTPPTLGSNAFDGTNDCPIQVPCGYASTYKSASGWSTYASRII